MSPRILASLGRRSLCPNFELRLDGLAKANLAREFQFPQQAPMEDAFRKPPGEPDRDEH